MSHNIRKCSYPNNCNRKAIQAEWDHYAAMEDWQEGCGGLGSDIRWLDNEPICANIQEADARIDALDKGWYDQLAIRYYVDIKVKESKAVERAKEAYSNAINSERELEAKIKDTFLHRKSEFVGCKECGSKISMKYLRVPVCPVCRANLLSDTDQTRLANAKQRVEITKNVWKKELAKVQDKANKAAKRRDVNWLVKIEYHT